MLEITSNGSAEEAALEMTLLGSEDESEEILSAIQSAAVDMEEAAATHPSEVGRKVTGLLASAIRDLATEVACVILAEQQRQYTAAQEAVGEVVDKLSEGARMLVLARLGAQTTNAQNRALIDAVIDYERRVDAEVAKTF